MYYLTNSRQFKQEVHKKRSLWYFRRSRERTIQGSEGTQTPERPSAQKSQKDTGVGGQ